MIAWIRGIGTTKNNKINKTIRIIKTNKTNKIIRISKINKIIATNVITQLETRVIKAATNRAAITV